MLAGEQVALRLALAETGDEVLLGDADPGETVDEHLDVVGRWRRCLAVELAQRGGDSGGGLGHVVAVQHHPARCVRRGEIVREFRRRQCHEVGHARVARRPPAVTTQVVAQQVLADLGLLDRADPLVDPAADLAPLSAAEVDAAALHLDDGDAEAGPGDDDVGLAILLPVAEHLAAHHDGVVG